MIIFGGFSGCLGLFLALLSALKNVVLGSSVIFLCVDCFVDGGFDVFCGFGLFEWDFGDD